MTGHPDHRDWRAETLLCGFEQSLLVQLVIDDETRIVLASEGAGRLFGWSRSDLIGQRLRQFAVPPSAIDSCQQSARCESGDPFELEFRTSSGSVVPVEVLCGHFVGPDDATLCYLFLDDHATRASLESLRTARLAKLSLLNQVSDALYGAHLTLEQVLEAVLICVAAGQGLRFNRAFLLLIDEASQTLRGEIAIGPSNHAEAERIWQNLETEPIDLFEMMTSYDRSLRETDVAVNEIVRHLSVPLAEEDHFLIRAMNGRQPMLVTGDFHAPGVDKVRELLGHDTCAVAPLTTHQGPVGVFLADNAISGSAITDLDLEFLQLFANQSANAIESSRLNRELERRLMDLRKAHRKQREDQQTLLRMERLSVMGETSAIVAHELRNPLVSIGGFARSLERNLPEGDSNREYAAIIVEEVGRLERIIHDLLDFIRPQKRLRKRVDCDQLIRQAVERMREQLAARNVLLEVDLQAGDVELNCHPGEIQQVMQNLVMNGAQAAADGGSTVRVTTRRIEGGVEIEVLDDGPGFPPEHANQLFSPFYSTRTTGSGLGLTICRQIIKAHGGVIRADNRSEGGARFVVVIPLPRPNGSD